MRQASVIMPQQRHQVWFANVVVLIGSLALLPLPRQAAAEIVQRCASAWRSALLGDTSPGGVGHARTEQGSLSLADAERVTPWAIQRPAWFPEPFYLADVTISTVPVRTCGTNREAMTTVRLTYVALARPPSGAYLYVFTQARPGTARAIVPPAPAPAAFVHERPALFLRIAGGSHHDPYAAPDPMDRLTQWDQAHDSAWLIWEDGALTNTLVADGFGMSQTEVIRIAESFQPLGVGADRVWR